MVYSGHSPRMEFNFEGQFLGFVRHEGKLKYLRLRVSSEEMQIKIPKEVRVAVGLSLQPGEAIRVVGTSKLDRHMPGLKLKATQIIPLTGQYPPIVPMISADSESSLMHESKIKPKTKSKLKVLVCQKSGCLKKGGKGLCEALDQILCERNLNQHVTIERTGCVKRCSAAPNVVIMPGNQRYTEVRHRSLPQIADAIAKHLARLG